MDTFKYLELCKYGASNENNFPCDHMVMPLNQKCYLKNQFIIHEEKPYRNGDMGEPSFKHDILNTRLAVNCNPEEKNFKCEQCGAAFKRKDRLKSHVLVHSDLKPFKCCECGSAFKRKDHLSKHIRIHGHEKPFKCNCGSAFKRKDHLQKHEKIHTHVREFKCDLCGNSFKRKDHMKKHRIIHGPEKPFKCDCGSAFKRKDHLQKHSRIHSGTQESQNFKCQICGASFKRKAFLKTHLANHGPPKGPNGEGACGGFFAFFKGPIQV